MLTESVYSWRRITCWPAGDPATSMQHPSYNTIAPPGYDAGATSVSLPIKLLILMQPLHRR